MTPPDPVRGRDRTHQLWVVAIASGAVLALATVFSFSGRAQTGPVLDVIDGFGVPGAVAQGAGRTFVGDGHRLLVVDTTDPARPALAGASLPLGGPVLDIAVAGNRAYVAAGSAGLVIVDVGLGVEPRIAGRYVPGHVTNVQLRDRRAYVVVDGKLLIADVADPGQVTVVGEPVENGVYGFVILRDAVWAVRSGALVGIDVADPSAPRELGSLAGPYRAVVTDDSRLYLLTATRSFVTVSVSVEGEPIVESEQRFVTANHIIAMAAAGNRLVVTGSHYQSGPRWHLARYSLAGTPVLLSRQDLPGEPRSVAVDDGRVALTVAPAPCDASDSHELAELRLYNEAALLGSLPLGATARDVAVSGDLAVVAAGAAGAQFFGIDEPSLPRLLATVGEVGAAIRVAIADGLALAASDRTLSVLSTVDHAFELVGALDTHEDILDIAMSGDVALVRLPSSVLLIDLSEPSQPRVAGTLAESSSAVALDGRRALVMADSWRDT